MIAARAYCSFEVEDHTFTLLSSAIFLSTLWVIYMIRFKLKPTYSKELDSMPLYSLVIKPHAPPGIPLLYSLSLSNSFPCMHACMVLFGLSDGAFSYPCCANPSSSFPSQTPHQNNLVFLFLLGRHLCASSASFNAECKG